MEFQTGNPEPGLFYVSLVPEAMRKLPWNNIELNKTIQYQRIRGPFQSEQEAKQEEQNLLNEIPKLETYVWLCPRRESPSMV